MNTINTTGPYALSRTQLMLDNPRILKAQERWADRSGGLDACHLYLSTKDEDGYGKRRINYQGQHITVPVSRIVTALTDGYIAANEQAAHRCHHPSCVNPRHLVAALRAEHDDYDAEPKRLELRAFNLTHIRRV